MSLRAALRIASRVVLPARILAVGLGVRVGVLVVVICTNRSVQKATPHAAPRQAGDRLPEVKGQIEERYSHQGLSAGSQEPRSVTAPPGRSEPPGGPRGPFGGPLKQRTRDAERGH